MKTAGQRQAFPAIKTDLRGNASSQHSAGTRRMAKGIQGRKNSTENTE